MTLRIVTIKEAESGSFPGLQDKECLKNIGATVSALGATMNKVHGQGPNKKLLHVYLLIWLFDLSR